MPRVEQLDGSLLSAFLQFTTEETEVQTSLRGFIFHWSTINILPTFTIE